MSQNSIVKSAAILLLLLALSLSICAMPSYAADIESCYVKKDTWAATMLATHRAYQAWASEDQQAENLIFGPWYEAGPFKSETFSKEFVGTRNIHVKAKDKDKKKLWKKRNNYADGRVWSLTPNIVGPTYLYRTITGDKATTISAGLGSDDGIAVWLNGKKILSKDVPRGVSPDQDTVSLMLKPGENELLLKIYNMRGGHGFYFSPGATAQVRLWQAIQADFPSETAWMRRDLGEREYLTWFGSTDTQLERLMIDQAIAGVGGAGGVLRRDLEGLGQVKAEESAWLALYVRACIYRKNLSALGQVDLEALRLAIKDLSVTYPVRYPLHYQEEVAFFAQTLAEFTRAIEGGDPIDSPKLEAFAAELIEFQREALLANPLLDFDSLLVIRRNLGKTAHTAMNRAIGMASLNSHNNTSITNPATAWDNEIVELSDLRYDVQSYILYKPDGRKLITDIDLHFDAQRLMFSMPGTHDRWNVFEINTDGTGLRQMTPDFNDVDHFDSCYLPNEKVIYTSTANFQGLPCEGGSKPMAPLYLMNRDGSGIRQLTFEQDSDWCPTVMNDGRVLYLRWEYSDTPHYFSRILFSMNPDGTTQSEYYGSGSYFPNAYFYARPLPNHRTAVVGIVGGHHGISRSGRLMIVDPAQGRHEVQGVVQEIPGRHKTVEPTIKDRLVDGVWPQFLHPYPLSDKYFLVSAKLGPDSLWGIYLVDTFDNMTLVAEQAGAGLFEPFPLQKTKRPPIIPNNVDLNRRDSLVYIADIYRGQGLAGIPRGSVKALRLFTYHFAHVSSGGHNSVGVESSWDVKRILGTVPVEEDGSAFFRLPANMPISLQPLDEKGRALQLMRSWMVGMPGETVSCIGCHEGQNETASVRTTIAALKDPVDITPWQGPARPFSFALEVQPVLDTYCVGCHNGKNPKIKGKDFANRAKAGAFNETYMALHPYVRRPGPESDIYPFRPMEYHVGTSELVQLLERGHHNVTLDNDAWEVINTWIDLNVPFRGQWKPKAWRGSDQDERRRQLAKMYANIDIDPEGEYVSKERSLQGRRRPDPIFPEPSVVPIANIDRTRNWPFDTARARQLQERLGSITRTIRLSDEVDMDLVQIPAGRFVMGNAQGHRVEQPTSIVPIDTAFWMGVCEVTNAQYALFDPAHDSRFIDQQWKDHTTPGYPANGPDQPVIRISWQEAMEFCAWLSAQTGLEVTLPTEAQWEWACRAGSGSEFYYGGLDTDFASYANLADESIVLHAVTGVNPSPVSNPNPFTDFIPRDRRFNDGEKIVTAVGRYQANVWGLRDMHGNVTEWTRSSDAPYPYAGQDGRNLASGMAKRVVRGGSWRDRPARATAAYRLAYEPYQKVFNVGFRVIISGKGKKAYARF